MFCCSVCHSVFASQKLRKACKCICPFCFNEQICDPEQPALHMQSLLQSAQADKTPAVKNPKTRGNKAQQVEASWSSIKARGTRTGTWIASLYVGGLAAAIMAIFVSNSSYLQAELNRHFNSGSVADFNALGSKPAVESTRYGLEAFLAPQQQAGISAAPSRLQIKQLLEQFANADSKQRQELLIKAPSQVADAKQSLPQIMAPLAVAGLNIGNAQKYGQLWSYRVEQPGKRLRQLFVLPSSQLRFSWDAWNASSQLEGQEFCRKMPQQQVEMCVQLQASNYYNYGFSNEASASNHMGLCWMCFNIQFPDLTSIYAYAPSDSQQCKYLLNCLQNGNNMFKLLLRYPEKNPQANQAIISEIVGLGWLNDYERSLAGIPAYKTQDPKQPNSRQQPEDKTPPRIQSASAGQLVH